MRKFSASWDLLKTSFAILRADKELILLPITSAILSAIAFVMMIGGWLFVNWADIRRHDRARRSMAGTRHCRTVRPFISRCFSFTS